MRTVYLIFMIIGITSTIPCFSQVVSIKVGYDVPGSLRNTVDVVKGSEIELPSAVTELKKINILSKNLPANHKLVFTIAGEPKDYNTPNTDAELTFSNNIIDKEIQVKHFDNLNVEVPADAITFRLIPEIEANDTPGTTGNILPSIDKFLSDHYSDLEPTPFGLLDQSDKKQIIHIFFDHRGNSLLSTVPQGISNAQYMIHIVYPISRANPNAVSFSVIQKTGSFNSGLLFNNAGVLSQVPGRLQSGERYDLIVERTFLLGTATDDLSFDIIAKEGSGSRTVLESYTIKMSPVFHGSFDFGLLRTKLSNPTYDLVSFPTSTDMVVKPSDESPKGVVTVMASFYVSPIILIESLVGRSLLRGKKIPFYKLTGRNFLDDHKIYERFYPTVGVSLNNNAFDNIFYGINWEIARGLAVFAGWHYGKVRTFEMPDFIPGVTPVTDKQFEFYQNNRWKTSTAVGVKLDILILRNLFGSIGAGQ